MFCFSWKAGWKQVRNLSPHTCWGGIERSTSLCYLPPPWNELFFCSFMRGKGKNLEGLDPCGFPLAKADPATERDLTMEKMLCSSDELWISASEKITLKARGLWGKGKELWKTKTSLWVHKDLQEILSGMLHWKHIWALYMLCTCRSAVNAGQVRACLHRASFQ